MNGKPARPILVLLSSHWLSMLGATLVTLAAFSWLFVLPTQISGHVQNPYIGILLFVFIPMVFFGGLILIPIGVALAKGRIQGDFSAMEDRRATWRRAGIFFAVMTAANLVIGSQLSYRAVAHMETVQFCGQTCHMMNPEFTGHLQAPHQAVACESCHITPGATGFLKAKLAGTRQLLAVAFHTFPRPIESALESNRLVSSAETCERCHARQKFIGPRVRIITKFNSDESNSKTETVLTMLIGGGRFGGIHGAHMGPGIHIRYAAADKKRQTIPWVEYIDSERNTRRIYLASDVKPGAADSLEKFQMQCVDCHNRAAHAFESADAAINKALAQGEIAPGLPFVKKTGLELIQAAYRDDDEAGRNIGAGLTAFYRDKYPAVAQQRMNEIRAAASALSRIYSRNVFPDLKVTWGTYVNNLGHMDSPGCFRCHDENHSTSDKRTITQDCTVCHQAVAVEEASPEVLKTLGIVDLFVTNQKP